MTKPKTRRWVGPLFVNGVLLLVILLWSVPTFGLLISSFRQREDIASSGWWSVFPHRDWKTTSEINITELNLNPDAPMSIEQCGGTYTFDELRAGVQTGEKTRCQWVGNKRLGRIEFQEFGWATRANLTLETYSQVLTGKDFEYKNPTTGANEVIPGDDFSGAIFNSIAVTIPATIIPILIAAFAAYGFAWMRFPGRRWFFILVIALLVVPLQIALTPILRDYNTLGINGTFLAIWLAHTGFGLPLATYLLYNYISTLPRETLESAFIDGASHFTVFTRLILPLSVPALASFAIFQFLWVWNDFLVALVFLGSDPELKVVTMRLNDIIGSRGDDWHLLTAGAFISMLLPLIVFFSLQRYFVRGLLAGSVKG